MQYVYGILFLLFTAYPVIFIEGHGFNAGQNALAFLPVFIGSICGAILVCDSSFQRPVLEC